MGAMSAPISDKPDTSVEENKYSEEEKDKIPDLPQTETSSDKKEEVKFLELTDSELVDVKKAIYDKAFEKFEEDYSSKD